jgi:hypothetical protein
MADRSHRSRRQPEVRIVHSNKTIDTVSRLKCDEPPSSLHPIKPARFPEQALKALILCVCGWSLLEAPLEFDVSNTGAWLPALIVSKLIVVTAGYAAITNVRFARSIFILICTASVLAIAPALPVEFKRSAVMGVVSMIECVSKAVCVIAFGVVSLQRKMP